MTNIVELDSLDQKILAIIQTDATLPIHEIGSMVGLSTNPCWKRIKRMEDSGLIEKRVALVNPAKLGLGATAFVTIRTNKHNPEWLECFARAINDIAEVIECHRMSGDVDYLLKIAVSDIAHYDRVYQKLIASVPSLSDVSSTFSMERLKYGTAYTVPPKA